MDGRLGHPSLTIREHLCSGANVGAVGPPVTSMAPARSALPRVRIRTLTVVLVTLFVAITHACAAEAAGGRRQRRSKPPKAPAPRS